MGSISLGGGAFGGTLNDCALNCNGARAGGGAYSSTLNRCTLSCNSAIYGGGVSGGTLNNCTLIANNAVQGGGADGGTLNNCTLSSNSVHGLSPFGGALRGLGGGARGATLKNCTLIGNRADAGEWTASGGGAAWCTLNNCIVYFNMGDDGPNYVSSTLNFSCTTPMPTNGVGNVTNAPLFVDQASGNLRLQSNSPCINAGLNTLAPAGPDLNGNPRIRGGSVDIGAYEFQLPTSIISYAWLQRYTLPTDGSADTVDPDGDGLNNWQEWRCATDPTNALSALRLLAPTVAGSDLLVRWESVADRTYFLELNANLSSAFTPLATGIPGQPGTTTYTHTNAIGAGPWFYRVGIQE
jgi:hypothetical protein